MLGNAYGWQFGMLRVWNVERNRISSQANVMKNLQRVERFVAPLNEEFIARERTLQTRISARATIGVISRCTISVIKRHLESKVITTPKARPNFTDFHSWSPTAKAKSRALLPRT